MNYFKSSAKSQNTIRNTAEESMQPIDCSGPLFSVLVPAYNREAYIGQAIASILAQQEADFELIVIDDGSTDRTVEIVESFQDSRLRVFYESHAGGAAARNKGISAAIGQFIVTVGSDDFIAAGALAKLAEGIRSCPEADIFYGDLGIFTESAPDKIHYTQYPDYYEVSLLTKLIQGNCLPGGGTAVRRALYLEYGLYDINFVRCHDYQMWTRLLDTAKVKKVDFVTYYWRLHNSNLSGTRSRAFEAKVVLDMFSRYPTSELFPDLKDDSEGNAEALWRLSETLEALQEYAYAYEAACKAFALGYGDKSRVSRLGQEVGPNFEPFFSVVIVTYNRPELLKYALDSLAGQNFQNFEVILVNDNGQPVEAKLKDFVFPLCYVRQERNRGPAAARNTALKLTRGRYITFLDDDDCYLSDHLLELALAIDKDPNGVFYSDAVFITEKVEGDVRVELTRDRRYQHGEYSKERLFVDNYIPINTFACPRSIILDVGGFDESLSALEDWDLLMRLAARVPFYHIQKETVQVRMRQPRATVERRSEHAVKNYPGLYHELYARHSDFGSEDVRYGRQVMRQRLGISDEVSDSNSFSGQAWLAARFFTLAQKNELTKFVQKNNQGPSIGVVLLDLQSEPEKIMASLVSLSKPHQSYTNIQPIVLTVNEAMINEVVQVVHAAPETWLPRLNEVLRTAAFDWFVLAAAGDEFTPNGLRMASLELLVVPDCRAVYCDEIYRQADGELGVAFRPAFNLDYLLSFPAGMAHHWMFRRDVLIEVGGFDTRFSDAFELELILRLITVGGLAGLEHISEPLLISNPPALANIEDERIAIIAHLQARGYADAQITAAKPGRYCLEYKHAGQPVVSILLPAGEHIVKLQRCVEGLLGNTAYQVFEILLIEDYPESKEVHDWLAALAQLNEPKLRLIQPASQSTAAILNKAASLAVGDYLLFLSADTAVLEEHWLDNMLNHAQRAEVGGVGSKLLTPNGKIAQAMQILGLQGPLGNPYVGEKLDEPGYMQRLQVDQNVSALSPDCLMLPRDLYLQLEGLDEREIPAPYAMTDLCLRIREAGYLLVWSPSVQLMLDRQESAGVTAQQQDAMYAKWLPQLARDPSYNPNFSLAQPGGFKLADTQISWRPLDIWRPLPVVLAHPADTMGCGHYRVMQPFNALREAGIVDGALSVGLMHVVDLERYNPDAVILQRQIGEERLEAMRRIKAFSRAFKVYELDDYLPNLPMKSAHRHHMPKDIIKSLRRGLSYVDRFVVSTDVMAEAFAEFHQDIRIVKNRLDPRWWGGPPTSARRTSSKPRVGWAGGASHTGDLEMIADVVKELADEVEWVFFGMCPDKLKPYIHEFHEGVAIERYAKKLASLNLDLALAPVEQNLFNECKSNLRLLEYGACGFPVICSDVRCYQDGLLPVTRVKNRFRDWVDAIRAHINDLDAAARAGDELRAAVLTGWMLEGGGLEAWREAWLPD